MSAAASPTWRPAHFFRRDGARLTCTLCPFACSLADDDRGRCHVRRRRGDSLETATFATSVTHLQPIERKPLYHVRPGRRVLTLAAPGCTFACTYCQNFPLSQYGRSPAAPWSARPLDPESLVLEAARADADIAFSYAEPILAAELTLALASPARAAGLAILWKTNGFITTDAARRLAPALTAVNVDLKAATDAVHQSLTGAPLSPILAALAAFRDAGVWIEISTPLIPGTNADEPSIRAIARLVLALGPDTPWHLLRFHPDYRLVDALPTHPTLLQRAISIAREEGLRHIYVERALGEAGRSTTCHACGATLLRRGVWELLSNRLINGRCPDCAALLPGRFIEVKP